MSISQIKVSKDLKASIIQAVNVLGGFKKFIHKNDRVLLKPNFNTADPFPASTDPEFLKAIVEILYEHEVREVIIGDACTFSQNTRRVMTDLGINEFEKLSPAPKIISFDEGKRVKKKIPNGKYLKNAWIPRVLDQIDKLILLPCLKTHSFAQFTGSLKLAIGFLSKLQRIKLHISHLQEKIAELNSIIHPDLIIMDARKCFINKGPSSGDIRNPNVILASTDRIAIDIEGIKTIQGFKGNSLHGIKPEDLPQIKRAIELGL